MQQPARVCFVVENLLPAGTELWIIRLIENLDRNRVTPFLCLLDGENELSRSLEPDCCETLRLGMNSICSRHGARSARSFYRFLRQHQMDIVQVHHADPTYFAVPIAKYARVAKVLQTKYDTGYWMKRSDVWLHRIFRRFIDFTVANCEACREASIGQEWSPRDKVIVVDNGIPLERLNSIADLNLPTHETVHVGMVCNLRPVKDPVLFVESASRVLRGSANVHFHIAGGGEMRSDLELRVAELGITDRFSLHGAIDDVPEFLRKMHITVLCSQSEGLPHSVLEYMAAGRATIVTNVGGNTELVQHDHTGQLVPVGDALALTNAINRFISDPAYANQMGRNARARISAQYSVEAMSERFESFYLGLNRNRTQSRNEAGKNRYQTA